MYGSAKQSSSSEPEISDRTPDPEAKITASQPSAKVQEILDGELSFQLDEHLKDALQIALLRAERLKSRVELALVYSLVTTICLELLVLLAFIYLNLCTLCVPDFSFSINAYKVHATHAKFLVSN